MHGAEPLTDGTEQPWLRQGGRLRRLAVGLAARRMNGVSQPGGPMQETIRKLLAAEAEARRLTDEAHAEERRLLDDAQRRAQELLAGARAEARVEAADRMRQAIEEAQAEKRSRLERFEAGLETRIQVAPETWERTIAAAVRCVRGVP